MYITYTSKMIARKQQQGEDVCGTCHYDSLHNAGAEIMYVMHVMHVHERQQILHTVQYIIYISFIFAYNYKGQTKVGVR